MQAHVRRQASSQCQVCSCAWTRCLHGAAASSSATVSPKRTPSQGLPSLAVGNGGQACVGVARHALLRGRGESRQGSLGHTAQPPTSSSCKAGLRLGTPWSWLLSASCCTGLPTRWDPLTFLVASRYMPHLHCMHWLFQLQRVQLGSLVVQGVWLGVCAMHCSSGGQRR